MKILIAGAGSIGNHIANAARSFGWDVTLTDTDPLALERTRNNIYPGRYGRWDDAIELVAAHDLHSGENPDVVFVGTPPDMHVKVAIDLLDLTKPRAVVVEKPFCGPDLAGCAEFCERVRSRGIFAAVGYNHVLGENTVIAERALRGGAIGTVQTISARTREHWGGIFQAHPWLSGPSDSYLGFAARGGGAAGEHSHAINIWQHFAHAAGAGRVEQVSATLDVVRDRGCEYDRACFLTLTTCEGLVGDVVQDVVTAPTEKMARIQGDGGFVEWWVGYEPGNDAVLTGERAQPTRTQLLPKTRADDFKAEIGHIADVLEGRTGESPISLERGLDTMMVIAAAFESAVEGRRVRIDWARGYVLEALRRGDR